MQFLYEVRLSAGGGISTLSVKGISASLEAVSLLLGVRTPAHEESAAGNDRKSDLDNDIHYLSESYRNSRNKLRVIKAPQTNVWLWIFGKFSCFVGKLGLSGFWGYAGYCGQPGYAPAVIWQLWGDRPRPT